MPDVSSTVCGLKTLPELALKVHRRLQVCLKRNPAANEIIDTSHSYYGIYMSLQLLLGGFCFGRCVFVVSLKFSMQGI